MKFFEGLLLQLFNVCISSKETIFFLVAKVSNTQPTILTLHNSFCEIYQFLYARNHTMQKNWMTNWKQNERAQNFHLFCPWEAEQYSLDFFYLKGEENDKTPWVDDFWLLAYYTLHEVKVKTIEIAENWLNLFI